MKVFIVFFLAFLPYIYAECPSATSIAPCTCVQEYEKSRVLCQGNVSLPRLTIIMREGLCGRNIDKFELIKSDVKYLPSNLFFKIAVRDIQISYTNISHFTRGGRSAFFGLESYLQSLSMRRCFLVDELQWQMIGDLRALSYLDFSYNDLTRVPRQWFHHPPPNLRSLILKGNSIATLEPGALTYMHKLVELDLSENKISVLERNFFPRPGNGLIFLRLSYNNIRSLPEDLFDDMMGLRRIYMDSNKLTALEESTWSPLWGDLDQLDVNGNGLLCNCEMLWIAKLRPPRRLYGECATTNATTKELRSLEVDDFDFCDA